MKREEETIYRWFAKDGFQDYKKITPMPLWLQCTIINLNGQKCGLCKLTERRILEESEENCIDLEELEKLIQTKLRK